MMQLHKSRKTEDIVTYYKGLNSVNFSSMLQHNLFIERRIPNFRFRQNITVRQVKEDSNMFLVYVSCAFIKCFPKMLKP